MEPWEALCAHVWPPYDCLQLAEYRKYSLLKPCSTPASAGRPQNKEQILIMHKGYTKEALIHLCSAGSSFNTIQGKLYELKNPTQVCTWLDLSSLGVCCEFSAHIKHIPFHVLCLQVQRKHGCSLKFVITILNERMTLQCVKCRQLWLDKAVFCYIKAFNLLKNLNGDYLT